MEQQLYGGSNRNDDLRVVSGKRRGPLAPRTPSPMLVAARPSTASARPATSSGAPSPARPTTSGGERSRSAGGSDDGLGGGRGGRRGERSGLRGLFFNILRSRYDSSDGLNAGADDGYGGSGASSPGGRRLESPRSIESQLVRREGSMHLPRPAECNMLGTHSGEQAPPAALFHGGSSSGPLGGAPLVRRWTSAHPLTVTCPITHRLPAPNPADMCIVRVRRNHLVEDALDEIARQYRRDLFKPLRVHFIGEEGIDAGGWHLGGLRAW
jgi:hypothetical protein